MLCIQIMVEIAYLKSYHHMGKALITCISGCSCEDSIIDGHQTDKVSQVRMDSNR